jgi:nicotinamide-nucleotide amidase
VVVIVEGASPTDINHLMQILLPLAQKIAARLVERRETIAIAEGSSGGLISAALLAVPGASKYFLGSAVIYTVKARTGLLDIGPNDMANLRPATEAYATLLARRVRDRLGASWALAETGAAGPSGNRYGDAAGHTCIAIVGSAEHALTIETGSDDRQANMRAFAMRALELTAKVLGAPL